METPFYDVYISTGALSWSEPRPESHLIHSAIFLTADDQKRLAPRLMEIRDIAGGDIRSFLCSHDAGTTTELVGELSTMLGSVFHFSSTEPLRSEDEAGEEIYAYRFDFIDEIVSALTRTQATAKVNTASAFPARRVGGNITGFTELGPHHWALILADFGDWAEGQRLWQDVAFDYFHDSLASFQAWIKEYPLLGASHAIGVHLTEAIRKAPVLCINREVWVRAREVCESKVYSPEDMGPPPSEKTGEGRYNHIGKPILYLSSDLATCGAELVSEGQQSLLWTQRFEVKNKRVLDLTVSPDRTRDLRLGEPELLVAALRGFVEEPSPRLPFKPEYYIPRFVGDVTRHLGLDGIRYSSHRGTGMNLAVFTWSHDLKPVGMPSVTRYTNSQYGPDIPPWQRNLYPVLCPFCGEESSESLRSCPRCGRQNPYFTMSDDDV